MAIITAPAGTPLGSIVTFYPEGYPVDPVTGHCNADPIGYAFVKDGGTISERFETMTEMYKAREKAMKEAAVFRLVTSE